MYKLSYKNTCKAVIVTHVNWFKLFRSHDLVTSVNINNKLSSYHLKKSMKVIIN